MTTRPAPLGLDLLPGDPVQLLSPAGEAVGELPAPEVLLDLHRRLVVGRRFDRQAQALVKQGRLAVYPSSSGQEACQVAPVAALQPTDWVFPTYRESVALVSRGIDPVEVLTLLRGDWHCGYNPREWRTAPQCTPLGTQAPHAVGLAHAARLKGDDVVALCFLGDGSTSEGDVHEALNFAAVYQAPVVFLVQNNGWAISVPLSKQTKAPSIAHKGIGYGVPGVRVDGNDAAAVWSVTQTAIGWARAGNGPTLIEAHTYRMDAHTNADDATRYRTEEELTGWRDKDPVERLERYLRTAGLLTDEISSGVAEEAEALATDLRTRMNEDPKVDPLELFEHVYTRPTASLRAQREALSAELAAHEEDAR
ncbi:MAG: 2-oxoisovalerate dehydrogenase component alpha subunit [Frankiaceae bacterium]|jgi:pyruvate dehydrogenase E1 component alpha subunit|nr:2-oxoisovalerate dehydrogenase component alpha subunit [Frankiaceae bacterium]